MMFILLSGATGALLIEDWGINDETIVNQFNNSIPSAPIKFDGNSLKFEAASGTLVFPELCQQYMLPCNFTGQIIGARFNGYNFPHMDYLLNAYARWYHPKAVVVYGNEPQGRELGSIQIFEFGESTTDINFPVIHISLASFEELVMAMNITGTFTHLPLVQVTDEGTNEFAELIKWYGPFFVVTHGIWFAINMVLGGIVLSKRDWTLNVGNMVIVIHLAGNIVRAVHTIDPYVGWLFPLPFTEMTLTLTVPFVITASILMTLHWYDVMYDSSLEVFAVLSKTRYIGAVVIPIVFIAEMVTGSLRATLGTGDWGYISGIVYAVVILTLIVTYFYVSIAILRRMSQILEQMNFRTRKLRVATVRILLSGVGLLISLFVSISFATPIVSTSLGDMIMRWLLFASANFITTNHILVFYVPKRRGQTSSANLTHSRSHGSQSA